jgi:hypothetical protein
MIKSRWKIEDRMVIKGLTPAMESLSHMSQSRLSSLSAFFDMNLPGPGVSLVIVCSFVKDKNLKTWNRVPPKKTAKATHTMGPLKKS